ncbi:hypothetical protein ACFX1R_006975 [Malus domestica]
MKAPPVRDVTEVSKVMMTGTGDRRKARAVRLPTTYLTSLGTTRLDHSTEFSADSVKDRDKVQVQGEGSVIQPNGRKKWQMRSRDQRHIEGSVGTNNQLHWLIPQGVRQSL